MRHSKQLTIKKDQNAERAIAAHAGFVSYVVGKVKKIGLEVVLQQYTTPFKATEYYWLKKAFERVMDFAEEVQIKKIPQKLGDDGTLPRQPIYVTVVNQTEKNADNLQAPRFAVPSIQ